MESHIEKPPIFKIELPKDGDEIELAEMHIQAWKESYIVPGSGLDEEKIDELLGHLLTDTDFRKRTIEASLEDPGNVLYRVVRSMSEEIVGFLHGSKKGDHNELEAIYLLNEAKGSGTGGHLMEEFLSWADKGKPSRLEVFAFNDAVIGFYEKFGFAKTDNELEMYKGFLPVTEMIRDAGEEGELTL